MVDLLAVAASSWGVLMGLAPALQIRRMLREQSSREISVGYFTILLAGFGLWIGYGAATGNLALVIPNSTALFTGTVLVITALRLRRGEAGAGGVDARPPLTPRETARRRGPRPWRRAGPAR